MPRASTKKKRVISDPESEDEEAVVSENELESSQKLHFPLSKDPSFSEQYQFSDDLDDVDVDYQGESSWSKSKPGPKPRAKPGPKPKGKSNIKTKKDDEMKSRAKPGPKPKSKLSTSIHPSPLRSAVLERTVSPFLSTSGATPTPTRISTPNFPDAPAEPEREKLKIRIRIAARPAASSVTSTPMPRLSRPQWGKDSSHGLESASDSDTDDDEEMGSEDEGLEEDAEASDSELPMTNSWTIPVGTIDPEPEEDEDEEMYPRPSARLTARQAVLASGSSPHVELDLLPSRRSRKAKATLLEPPETESLTPEELAQRHEEAIVAKKEEAARKREEMAQKRRLKGLKKLQDDKDETINRLLKKQSKATRLSRNARGPGSAAEGTATKEGSVNLDVSGQEDNNTPGPSLPVGQTPPVPSIPVSRSLIDQNVPTVRWISTSRATPIVQLQGDASNDVQTDTTPTAPSLSVSFPTEILSQCFPSLSVYAPPRSTPTCAVHLCSRPRKYRLVGASDREIGACGMEHLKVLRG